MSLTHFAEINFYVDGELGPEETADLLSRLERNALESALCDAFLRQKKSLVRALDLLEAARAPNLATSLVASRLADTLMRRIAPAAGAEPGPGTNRTVPKGG